MSSEIIESIKQRHFKGPLRTIQSANYTSSSPQLVTFQQMKLLLHYDLGVRGRVDTRVKFTISTMGSLTKILSVEIVLLSYFRD